MPSSTCPHHRSAFPRCRWERIFFMVVYDHNMFLSFRGEMDHMSKKEIRPSISSIGRRLTASQEEQEQKNPDVIKLNNGYLELVMKNAAQMIDFDSRIILLHPSQDPTPHGTTPHGTWKPLLPHPGLSWLQTLHSLGFSFFAKERWYWKSHKQSFTLIAFSLLLKNWQRSQVKNEVYMLLSS